MEPVTHKTHPLSLRHAIYKGIHICQSKAYCTYYLHTQKYTHPRTHEQSEKLLQYNADVLSGNNYVDYDPSTQRHCYLAPCILQGKTKLKTGRANELRVTGAVRALSAGGKEARLGPTLLQCSSWSGKKKKRDKLKMPPTTLRAHIAMVTSRSATSISSIRLS